MKELTDINNAKVKATTVFIVLFFDWTDW